MVKVYYIATQSIIVSDNRENLLETAAIEANSVINFFNSNGLVNNADKAAVLYNSKGKSEVITIENVGGENLVSTYSEKTSWPTYKLRFFMDNSYR